MNITTLDAIKIRLDKLVYLHTNFMYCSRFCGDNFTNEIIDVENRLNELAEIAKLLCISHKIDSKVRGYAGIMLDVTKFGFTK